MKGIVETVAGVIERLSISSTEKKRLKQELETLLVDYEREHLQVQSGVLRSEAQGNWLQRSWRPVIMLAFTVVILVGMFTDLPMPEDTFRFWDLLEIGLGGYIVGRFRMSYSVTSLHQSQVQVRSTDRSRQQSSDGFRYFCGS